MIIRPKVKGVILTKLKKKEKGEKNKRSISTDWTQMNHHMQPICKV